jgi:hypothetical protein
MTFVWTQVRQALQQTAAMGAWSPYVPAAWASLPVAKAFTSGAYLSRRSGLLCAAKQPAETLCCVECGAERPTRRRHIYAALLGVLPQRRGRVSDGAVDNAHAAEYVRLERWESRRDRALCPSHLRAGKLRNGPSRII